MEWKVITISVLGKFRSNYQLLFFDTILHSIETSLALKLAIGYVSNVDFRDMD
jgi:hypothetical protein